MIQQISVTDLKTKMDAGNKPFLLDVRETFEREICKLNDDKHIPMKEISNRMSELDKNKEIVVYCRSGGRSLQICQFLDQQGFKNVTNLKGGILAWADFVDPTIQKY